MFRVIYIYVCVTCFLFFEEKNIASSSSSIFASVIFALSDPIAAIASEKSLSRPQLDGQYAARRTRQAFNATGLLACRSY